MLTEVSRMPRNLNVVLDWDGPWQNADSAPKRAGIYLVVAGSETSDGKWSIPSYKLLDIGQSGETGVRLDTHDRRECWNNEKSTDKIILFKFGGYAKRKARYN